VLAEVETLKSSLEPQEVADHCRRKLVDGGFDVEYFAVINAQNLQPLHVWDPEIPTLACSAAWLGNVRLIDNLSLF
jgi:pantothenate synthetase